MQNEPIKRMLVAHKPIEPQTKILVKTAGTSGSLVSMNHNNELIEQITW